MTNAETVTRKLATLVEFLRRARTRRPDTAEALARDVDRLDALGMAILVAVQEAIDISFHIVVDERWGTPASYAESFEMLAARGVIAPELAPRMAAACGLRNRLAHGYAGVDPGRLWLELPQGLEALDEYARAVGAFIAQK